MRKREQRPVPKCRFCGKVLRDGPNGLKAVGGGYTCWEAGIGAAHQLPESMLGMELEQVQVQVRPIQNERARQARPKKMQVEADRLRRIPGEWDFVNRGDLFVGRSASSVAHGIRTASLAAFRPAGSFEAKADGARVKARYIGSNEALTLPDLDQLLAVADAGLVAA